MAIKEPRAKSNKKTGQKSGMKNKIKTVGQKQGANNKMGPRGQKGGFNKKIKNDGKKGRMNNNMKPGGQKAGMNGERKAKGETGGVEGKEKRRPRVFAGKRGTAYLKEREERKRRAIVKAKQIEKQRARKLVEDLEAEEGMQKRMKKLTKKEHQSLLQYKAQKKENVLKVSKIKHLVDRKVVYQAVSAIRKLENKVDKSRDVTHSDAEPLFMQVTLVKMHGSLKTKDINKKTRIKVKLPRNPISDSNEVLLITRDKFSGKDFSKTIEYFKYKLQKNKVNDLITEVMPVKQLRLEHSDFEAKKNLAYRFDVVLCDQKAMPGIEKLLGKHFFKRNKYPVECYPLKKDLKKEINRALSTTNITFGSGNCASMKVGNLSQTDEELARNIVAAVRKIAVKCPGGWDNVQNMSLKRLFSVSVPFYVNLNPMNAVNRIEPKPTKQAKKSVVSGSLTTHPSKSVMVYPDGSVFLGPPRLDEDEREKKQERDIANKQKRKQTIAEKREKRRVAREEKEKAKRARLMGKENPALQVKLKNKEVERRMIEAEMLQAKMVPKENVFNKENDQDLEKEEKQTVAEKKKKKKKGKKLSKAEERKKSKNVVSNEGDSDNEEHWLIKADKHRKPKAKKGNKKVMDTNIEDMEVDFDSGDDEGIEFHEKAYLEQLSKKRKAESSKNKDVDAWAEDSESDSDMDG